MRDALHQLAALIDRSCGVLAFLAAVLVQPAAAQDCASLSGAYAGKFTAERKRGSKDLPPRISGSWSATLDGRTCAMRGTVSSEFTGTVNVKGEYSPDKSGAKGFEPWRVYLQEGSLTKYTDFALGNSGPNVTWVGIGNAAMHYEGSFTVESVPQASGGLRQAASQADPDREATERRQREADATDLAKTRSQYAARVKADEELARLNRDLKDRQRCMAQVDRNDCSCSRFFPTPPPPPGVASGCSK